MWAVLPLILCKVKVIVAFVSGFALLNNFLGLCHFMALINIYMRVLSCIQIELDHIITFIYYFERFNTICAEKDLFPGNVFKLKFLGM